LLHLILFTDPVEFAMQPIQSNEHFQDDSL